MAQPSTIFPLWSRRLLLEHSHKVGLNIYKQIFVNLLSLSSPGLPNTLWRIRKSVFIVLPPFIMSYLIFTETEKEHERLQRKQPGQFDHET